MKKIILTTSILFSTYFGYSQNQFWSLGLAGTPNFYSIKSQEGSDHLYESNVGLSLGLETFYSLGDKLDLGIGLHFTTLNYRVNYGFTFLDPGDPDIPRLGQIKANYIDIPVLARIKMYSGNKIGVYASIALNSSFLAHSDDQTNFEDGSVREYTDLNTFLISGQLGIGLAYRVNDGLKIKFEPEIRSYFKGFDDIMSPNPILFQTMLGLEFKLGKDK